MIAVIDFDIDLVNGELLNMTYEQLKNPDEDDREDHTDVDPDLQVEKR